MGYQDIHRQIVDYEGYQFPNSQLWFRGPQPIDLQPQKYFVSLGAAQTFGCFCPQPYPKLLSDKLDFASLNLGYGGAGPFFYLKHDELWDSINNARFAIIQVMSGRSESNSLFDSGGLEYLIGRSDGKQLSAENAYIQLLNDNYPLGNIPAARRWTKKLYYFKANKPVQKIVTETRNNWVNNYKQLLTKIKVPKILFWFSKREPDYRERYSSLAKLFGEFPQLVNAEMVDEIKSLCDDYVECLSDRGSPQLLIDRFTGEPTTIDLATDPERPDISGIWTHNTYYPSPEMQIDAANVLESACRKYIPSAI